jgi:hypothetical protein
MQQQELAVAWLVLQKAAKVLNGLSFCRLWRRKSVLCWRGALEGIPMLVQLVPLQTGQAAMCLL